EGVVHPVGEQAGAGAAGRHVLEGGVEHRGVEGRPGPGAGLGLVGDRLGRGHRPPHHARTLPAAARRARCDRRPPAAVPWGVLAILPSISGPADLRELSEAQLTELAAEIRQFIVDAVSNAGSGHLGSNLGAVELTLALHRVFESPRDIILWDTGHQAYVHKIVTGRAGGFATLRKQGGLSGYPSREESEHDWIENSHASTVISYAHGL